MKKTLLLFLALQVLDVVTTIVALAMGGAEKNPLMAQIMAFGTIRSLIVSKLLVLGLAAAFILIKKTKAVQLANVVFALIVIWNITVIARLAWST